MMRDFGKSTGTRTNMPLRWLGKGVPRGDGDCQIPFTKIGSCNPEESAKECYERLNPPEPMDVPAVQIATHTGPVDCNNAEYCSHTKFTCADKSRVLLTSEDGKKHCIKFPEAK